MVEFEKYDIFEIFQKFKFFIKNSSDNICILLAWLVSSTSPSGGNQVDGLPKTIAKRARLGPRTTVLLTMIMMSRIIIPSTSGLGSELIVLDNVLKICIELIKQQNDNAKEKFYRV